MPALYFGGMKESYHICFTSHDEVMFRDEEDHGMFVNLLALRAYAEDADSSKEDQFVLNVAPSTAIPAPALEITEIKQAASGWDITVECTIQGVDLGGTVGTARVGNGYLAVSYAETLGGTWTTENIALTASANGKVTVNVNKAGAKFMKVKLTAKQEAQQ